VGSVAAIIATSVSTEGRREILGLGLGPSQAAAILSVFAPNTQSEGPEKSRHVADQCRARLPKLAVLMEKAQAGVIAFMAFPKPHWPKQQPTNPIEAINNDVKRRADGGCIQAETYCS